MSDSSTPLTPVRAICTKDGKAIHLETLRDFTFTPRRGEPIDFRVEDNIGILWAADGEGIRRLKQWLERYGSLFEIVEANFKSTLIHPEDKVFNIETDLEFLNANS